ncbi:UNVERIFIED_CONTAM: hypothetical protein GTU68_060611 [Idotea baltica]|nr:hypothetical protein [Idotea baltica]
MSILQEVARSLTYPWT